ncbi:hypothetical protein MS3_00003213 [Schistosoma haematobium]|uniref:PARG catalytic Macro domain-containing protein n=1 Tax=Schistosoma haematobium TaxID=6185 RepID=A0A922LP05_SCHHA|nr:hypothetical protein MS3_00003213 [Schistosoma haematobium]KAH9590591.1 hypothetical protein MS3_00003213 [Schistosoma haematobium]
MIESLKCVQYFKGDPLDELTSSSPCLPPLQPSRTHKVFFRCDSNPVKPPIPYPDDYQDKWNGLFVRMPCSPESVYPVYEGGANSLISRWVVIEKALRNKIKSSDELKEAILSYNYRFKSYWNFKTLEQLCMMNLIPDGGNDNFFGNTLSGICSLALNLPIFVTKVDFANSYLGGGVLNSGCVQEEIMFALRPELLVSCLFVERLGFDETLIIEGAEQYSVGSGYADDFCWAGDFIHSDSGMKR